MGKGQKQISIPTEYYEELLKLLDENKDILVRWEINSVPELLKKPNIEKSSTSFALHLPFGYAQASSQLTQKATQKL
jgi:hypothetical protein